MSSTGARALGLMAGNAVLDDNFPQAAAYSDDAERIFQRVTPGERPEALNLLREGYYKLKSKDVGGALASFRKAGEILKNPTVGGGARPEAILPWLDALQQSGGNKAGLAEEMFGVAQLARSSLTAQAIAQATARLVAGDPKVAEALLGYEDRKRDFERLQNERDQAVASGAAAERLAALDKQIGEAKKARDEAEAVILERAPEYVKAGEQPVTVADVRATLAPDEAFMFFLIADSGSYGFIVRPGTVSAYPVPLDRGAIAKLVDRLRQTTIAKPNGLPTPDFAASYKLYSALFGPAETELAGVDRVTIATAGDLLRYPLQALVTQPGAHDDNGDFRKVPFLVRRFAMTYVPSPRVFVNLRKAPTATPGLHPFIGFGDFQPGTTAQLAASFPPARCQDDYQRLSQGLVRLPETRNQVTAIAHQLGAGPGDIVLGEAFNKQRLASPDLANYRIVLFATHAFLQESLRCFAEAAAITVSVPPRAANADAEFEGISDIEKMKLNADLVALSACDTSGAGGVGESLSGLARAFFLRGAHGLLVTHWTVVTGASVPLMIGTFAAGKDSAQALRTAQLHMIDSAGSGDAAPIEISHPNYWSAFVLIGDGVRGTPGA
jgi:CHAT domain-containing protein